MLVPQLILNFYIAFKDNIITLPLIYFAPRGSVLTWHSIPYFGIGFERSYAPMANVWLLINL